MLLVLLLFIVTIEAALESYRSDVYSHYIFEVCRVHNNTVTPPAPYEIVFKFSCKYYDSDHTPHYRARTKTGHGTSTLHDGADRCDTRRLISTVSTTPSPPAYSKATHRALLAVWSAHSHRSFNSLTDKFHRMEVEYLRPGTTLPASSTISRDVKVVHARYAPRVRQYFQVSA